MLKSTILTLTATLMLTGCNSQQKQAEKHDKEFRQQVEQKKKQSNAFPVNGSNANHYIP